MDMLSGWHFTEPHKIPVLILPQPDLHQDNASRGYQTFESRVRVWHGMMSHVLLCFKFPVDLSSPCAMTHQTGQPLPQILTVLFVSCSSQPRVLTVPCRELEILTPPLWGARLQWVFWHLGAGVYFPQKPRKLGHHQHLLVTLLLRSFILIYCKLCSKTCNCITSRVTSWLLLL